MLCINEINLLLVFGKSQIFIFLLPPTRPSVPGDWVLSLWWPGGLPAQEQAHLPAVLCRKEPRRRLPHLRGKHSAEPEERVRRKNCMKSSLRAAQRSILYNLWGWGVSLLKYMCCIKLYLAYKVWYDVWPWINIYLGQFGAYISFFHT